VDEDGSPGDEALQVVITPQDSDGSAVKVPGNAVVQAFELTPDGLKVPLSRWEVPALELQRNWRSGLFTTGYSVTLPWKTWPSTDKLRVVVQFITLPNNRPFEAERDVTIKRAPGAPPRPGIILPGTEMLPPPIRLPDAPADGPILAPGAAVPD